MNGNEVARYIEFFKGWVAFKHGRAVRTKDKRVRVFQSEQEALAAALKSRMSWGRARRFGF